MVRITFEFPDRDPNGATITEDEVTAWGNTILKPMISFTGMEVRIIEVKSVIKLPNHGDSGSGLFWNG